MVSGAADDRCNEQRRLMPIGPTDGGFTLMEVLVALSIVAIALTAVYHMHTQTLYIYESSRWDTMATLLARKKLADLNVMNLSEFNGDSGSFDDAPAGYTWEIQTENLASDQFQEDGPILKRIQITIRSEDGTPFTLTTYRHLYE